MSRSNFFRAFQFNRRKHREQAKRSGQRRRIRGGFEQLEDRRHSEGRKPLGRVLGQRSAACCCERRAARISLSRSKSSSVNIRVRLNFEMESRFQRPTQSSSMTLASSSSERREFPTGITAFTFRGSSCQWRCRANLRGTPSCGAVETQPRTHFRTAPARG